MAINTGNFGKALWPGINKWYGDSYNEHQKEYTELFDTFSSRKAFEEDVSVSAFGLAPVKPQGSGVSYDSMQQGFVSRYNHVVYALGFIITREMKEDDLYDIVGKRNARSLAMSMNQTKETIAANVYNRAFDNGYTGGDGLELCSTLHVNIAGGTYANELTTAADLSEASLEQACIDLMAFENDRGLKINVMPKKLIIPTALAFEAERILNTIGRVGTADNDLNALKSLNKFPGGVVVNHYLTDADAWFIRTTAPDGMKHFERRADDFTLDNDFDTDNAKFKATARYSFGWSDPRGIFGSPGA
jgi:hypothetical protein